MALQKNPLTVRGRITRCWLFVHAVSVEQARSLLPPAFEPVTHNGRAFFNTVVSELRHMRPKGFPALAGLGYRHSAYRLYVRYHPPTGQPVEGLYFLRSDADNRLMALLGNRLTDFRFHYAPIHIGATDGAVDLRIDADDAPATVRLARRRPEALPPTSVFGSLDEAAAFLKYKPAGLSLQRDGSVNVVRIMRNEEAWRSRLVVVDHQDWAFLRPYDASFEIAYDVEPVEYQWNRATVYPSS